MKRVAMVGLMGLAGLACTSGDDDDAAADAGTFPATAGVGAATADVPPEAVDAQEASATVGQALAAVASDDDTQALLETGTLSTRKAELPGCIAKTRTPPRQVVLDFAGCADARVTGTATVVRKLNGPTLVTFGTGFTVVGLGVAGSLVMDRAGDALTYRVQNSDADGASAGQASTALRVTDATTTTLLTLDATLALDVAGHRSQVFGQGTGKAQGSSTSHALYFGGASAADVGNPSVRQPVTSPLPANTCSCPTSGIVAAAATITITKVELDVAEMLGVDCSSCPGLEHALSPARDLTGTAIITFTGCGSIDVGFRPEDETRLDISVTAPQLRGSLDLGCSSGRFNADQCSRLRSALGRVPSGHSWGSRIGRDVVDREAKRGVRARIGDGLCGAGGQ